MKITKLTASLLFAHSYKLVDKTGFEVSIVGVDEYGIKIIAPKYSPALLKFNEIGVNFFVLCRPYSSLTKEVNGVVPIVELAKYAELGRNWYAIDGIGACQSGETFSLTKSMSWSLVGNRGVKYTVYNQELLFNKLYSYHFKPSSLPDECCRFIEG